VTATSDGQAADVSFDDPADANSISYINNVVTTRDSTNVEFYYFLDQPQTLNIFGTIAEGADPVRFSSSVHTPSQRFAAAMQNIINAATGGSGECVLSFPPAFFVNHSKRNCFGWSLQFRRFSAWVYSVCSFAHNHEPHAERVRQLGGGAVSVCLFASKMFAHWFSKRYMRHLGLVLGGPDNYASGLAMVKDFLSALYVQNEFVQTDGSGLGRLL
jgi:hypothetical protein